MSTEASDLQSQRLEHEIGVVACGTVFDVQALIEGAKAITDSLDLGSDERPYQIVRLLNKAQAGVQELQDMLDKVAMNIRSQQKP